MKKRATFIAGATLMLATGGLISAPSASAVGDCNTWKSNKAPWTGYAYCSGMAWGDEFRVKITCISPHGTQFIVYGPWRSNTGTSSAKCSDNPNVGIYKVGWAFEGQS